MKIFLIGYMGSGKTTVGKKMSKYFNFKFVDLDFYLENKYKKSISDIFKTQGESVFRKMETDVLKEVVALDEDLVVSTGGGTPCFNNNMSVINSSGLSVYLSAPVGVLVNRLEKAKSKRPIIANKSHDELFSFIEKHLNDREPYYNQSKLKVCATNFWSKLDFEAIKEKLDHSK